MFEGVAIVVVVVVVLTPGRVRNCNHFCFDDDESIDFEFGQLTRCADIHKRNKGSHAKPGAQIDR